jgi:prefoldin subunit 5
MAGTPWNTMEPDEKLDWLRSQVEALRDSIAHLNNSLTGSFNRANTNLEKIIKELAAEVADLKKRAK